MTATTSDERREVAENLRKQLRYMRENNSYDEDADVVDCGNSAYRNIAGSVEPYGNFEKGNYVHIVERLADLIDPTCHNRQIAYNRASPEEFRTDNFICSTCGELFCADPDGVNHPIDWAYCPNCGARVVMGGEG